MPRRVPDTLPDLRHRLRLVAMRAKFLEPQLAASREAHLATARRPLLLTAAQETLVAQPRVSAALLEAFMHSERVRGSLLDPHDSRF